MKKKFIWLVLSLSIVAALVLASCAPAAVEEKGPQEVAGEAEEGEAPAVTPEEEEAPAAEEEAAAVMESVTFYKLDGTPVTVEVKPAKYGGWLTTSYNWEGITSLFDPVLATTNAWANSIYLERLAIGDWTRGPRGTNEFSFTAPPGSDSMRGPNLATSWDIIDLKTYVFYLREGVYFHDIPPANAREAVADDWKKEWERHFDSPKSALYYPDDPPVVTVIDKYTFKLEMPFNDISVINNFGLRHPVIPWEIVDEDGTANDPDLQIGTGAFMLDDVVSDVSLTYVKNPNYWKYDPFHPQNKLPYLDGVAVMIIPDFGTEKAAFRTGKIDLLVGLTIDATEEMWETAPWANWRLNERTGAINIWMNTQIEPWNDVRVRRAISMAIDNDYYNEIMWKGLGALVAWPLGSWAGDPYTPYEELPPDVKVLFEHHPDEAKALLAEAGYPSIDTTFIVPPSGPYLDTALVVQEMLAEVGVNVTIETTEDTSSLRYSHAFPGFMASFWQPAHELEVFGYAYGGMPQSIYNYSNVVDPIAVENFEIYMATADPVERTAFMKEENLREMALSWSIPMPSAGVYYFWQPWIKNYGGEAGTGPEDAWGWHTTFQYFWLDQELKKELGF